MPSGGKIQHTLWHLVAGPTIWSLFFLASYIAAAVHCAKQAATDLATLKAILIGLAVTALGAISVSAVHAYRAWTAGPESGPPHEADTPESRQQFVAFATLLLSGLSAVATIYVTLPALIFTTCR